MFFKVSNLNSNLALTQGYLNLALNNSAQVFRKFYRFPVYNVKRQLIMPYIDQNFLRNFVAMCRHFLYFLGVLKYRMWSLVRNVFEHDEIFRQKIILKKKMNVSDDLLIAQFSFIWRSFGFPAVAEDAKFTEFLKRRVNLSFLKFVLLRHRKLHGHVYLACE